MPHIVNHKYADTSTAIAGADHAALGMICKVTNSNGKRLLTPIGDTEDALVVEGNYAIAMKYSTDEFEATSSTAAARLGDRKVSIKQNDVILEVRRGAIVSYTPAEVDASLDPARSGTMPTVGQALGVSGSRWATAAAATTAGIASPVIGRVFKVYGTSEFEVELL